MVDVLQFCTLSTGTAFAIPTAPRAVLAAYLVNGQQYMLRGAKDAAGWLIPPTGWSYRFAYVSSFLLDA
jgi:hypothetical protein